MRLLVIRHGESLANIHDDLAVRPGFEGMRDPQVPLTQWGFEQAKEAGKFLREQYQHNPAFKGRTLRIVHSPYLRTRQTTQAIILGLEGAVKVESIQEDPRLFEQNFGIFDCITNPRVASARWPEEYAAFREARRIDKYHAKAPGGESRGDVVERLKPVVKDLLTRAKYAKNEENVDVLVVGHGLVNRALEMNIRGEDSEWLRKMRNPHNCAIRLIEGDREKGFQAEYIHEGKRRPDLLPKDHKTQPYGQTLFGWNRAA